MKVSGKSVSRLSGLYLFPILIPIFLGLLNPVINLMNDIQQIETKISEAKRRFAEDITLFPSGIEEKEQEMYQKSWSKLVARITKILPISMIAVDIWALSTLFAMWKVPKKSGGQRNKENVLRLSLLALLFHSSTLVGFNLLYRVTELPNYLCWVAAILFFSAIAMTVWVRETVWQDFEKPKLI